MNKLYVVMCLALAACYAGSAYGAKPKKNKNSIVYRQAQQVKALRLARERREKKMAKLKIEDKKIAQSALDELKTHEPYHASLYKHERYNRALDALVRAADGRVNLTYALNEAHEFYEVKV